MKLPDFQLMIRVLHSIDSDQLDDVFGDAHESRGEFAKFRENPPRYLIRCDDEKAAAIWAVARKRYDPQLQERLNREDMTPTDFMVDTIKTTLGVR